MENIGVSNKGEFETRLPYMFSLDAFQGDTQRSVWCVNKAERNFNFTSEVLFSDEDQLIGPGITGLRQFWNRVTPDSTDLHGSGPITFATPCPDGYLHGNNLQLAQFGKRLNLCTKQIKVFPNRWEQKYDTTDPDFQCPNSTDDGADVVGKKVVQVSANAVPSVLCVYDT